MIILIVNSFEEMTGKIQLQNYFLIKVTKIYQMIFALKIFFSYIFFSSSKIKRKFYSLINSNLNSLFLFLIPLILKPQDYILSA